MSVNNGNSNGSPIVQSNKGRGKVKLIAIILVVIVIIAGVGIVAYYQFAKPSIVVPAITSTNIAIVGEPYNFTLSTTQKFSNLTVYYGDGTSTSLKYNGGPNYQFAHSYSLPGSAYVYFTESLADGKSFTSFGQLVQVNVNPSASYVSNQKALGIITYNSTGSSVPLVSNQTIYRPGSFVNMSFGYYTEPSAKGYKVVNQTVTILLNGTSVKSYSIPYAFNEKAGSYQVNSAQAVLNYTFSQSGMYEVLLSTETAKINSTTGAYNSSSVLNTYTFADVASFNNGGLATSTSSLLHQTILVNSELEQGGYQSLDPAVAFDTVSDEIMFNTMLPLVGFNGSSTSSFIPILAAKLPSVQNGEINNNYVNYTVKYTNPSGKTIQYAVNETPYENYTFDINPNATFQNGQKITAWDFAYEFARVLLFDGGAPLTGGWMIAPYYLPGSYTKSNTFYNITQNMTVDNATNSITFHFQHPMTTQELFGLLTFYRVTSATWLQQHGAGITWSPSGFQAYKSQGSESGYNTYVQNNVMASGPYMIDYIVPGTEVVLQKNPNYHAVPGYPAAKINEVIIQYISQASTTYLNLKSGASQIATIPTSSWNEVQSLEKAGQAKAYTYSTPDVYFYKFNTNIDTTELAQYSTSPNVPASIFTSLNVRRAWAYAYDYSYFLDYQVGNKIFNQTFGQMFAGFLEQGVTFSQNYSVMQNVSQVPTYDLKMANQYWNDFVNGSEGAKVGVSWDSSTGKFMYNGAPLSIPIFIQSADPTDLEGATTWSQNLEKIIPGLTVQVVALPFTEMIALTAAQPNPLSVFWWGLAPAYAYPTDSVAGSEMPSNSSHLTGEDITPYWFNSPNNPLANSTQAAELQDLLTWEGLATSTPNTSIAEFYFHKINELFVNLTLCVYVEQANQYHILSTKLNQTSIVQYEENGLLGNALLYNYLSFS
ncbi:MAG: ABC transporter substrate-binding protein [Candidatus Thermoplasmatota archaeon]|nr:ABC transporter substrate-binding protein [Candidatus Thermoplasmatota archaeon]